MNKKLYLFFLIFFNLLFFFIISGFLKNNISNKLSWDEADYVNASKLGFYENIFENNSKTFIEHTKIGLNKIAESKKPNLATPQDISQYKLEDDVFYLRHFHPPLLNLYIYTYDKIFGVKNDKNLIKFKLFNYNLFFLFFTIFFYFYRKNINIIKLLSLVFIFIIFFQSNIFINAISKINYHILFGPLFIIYISVFYNFVKNQKKNNIFYLSLITALIFFTLETALIVFLIPLFFFYFVNNKIIFNKIFLLNFLKVLCLSFVIFLFLWPSNIYNLSLIKTYSMYFYRIVFQANSEYSDLKILNILYLIVKNNYIILMLFLIFLFKDIFKLKKRENTLIYLILFSLFSYLIIMLPFTHNTIYMFPVFTLIVAYICHSVIITPNTKYLYFFNFILVIFIIINLNYKQNRDLDSYSHDIYQVIDKIDKKHQLNFLADGAHIFDYYSQNNKFVNLEVYDKYNPGFYIKNNNYYLSVENLISIKYFDGIIIQKNRNFKKEQLKKLLEYGYKLDNSYEKYYLFNKTN